MRYNEDRIQHRKKKKKKNCYELTKEGEVLAQSDSPTQLRELGFVISGKLTAAKLANSQHQFLLEYAPEFVWDHIDENLIKKAIGV